MAAVKQLNKALNKVISENIETTLESLSNFLVEKKVENIASLIEEFKNNLVPVNVFENQSVNNTKRMKKTRTPSKYNLYIRDKMKELKEKDPSLTGQFLLKAATQSWNSEKAKTQAQ